MPSAKGESRSGMSSPLMSPTATTSRTQSRPTPTHRRASRSSMTELASTSVGSSAAGARELDERHGIAAERVLRQATVPLRQVLLLDERRRQRGGDPGVVGGLGLALDPGRLGHSLGLLARGVAPALGGGRDDLRLALSLDQLVALLLGFLLLDLLRLDGLLVVLVEADVRQRGLLELDPVLGEPHGEVLLD